MIVWSVVVILYFDAGVCLFKFFFCVLSFFEISRLGVEEGALGRDGVLGWVCGALDGIYKRGGKWEEKSLG